MENLEITQAQIQSLSAVRKELIQAYNKGTAINFVVIRELDNTIEALLKANSLN